MLSFHDRLPRRLFLAAVVFVAIVAGLLLHQRLLSDSPRTWSGDYTPEELTTSQGRFADHVKLAWSPVDDAEYYQISRDGVHIATVTDAKFRDGTAHDGGVPEAPRVKATDDETHRVDVTWWEPSVPDGTRHTYRVYAGGPWGVSEPTRPVEGYRSGYDISSYELSIDGGPWFDPADDTAVRDAEPWAVSREWLLYRDFHASQPVVDAGTSSATQDTHIEYVALELKDTVVHPGEPSSYRVRALNLTGTGDASQATKGELAASEISVQWQRSAGDSDGDFEDIEGATSKTFKDRQAPADQTPRYYRAVVDAAGADTVVSDSTRGHRAERTHCPLPLSHVDTRGTHLLDDDSRSTINYQVVDSGCAPGGGYMCDNRSCCGCMVEKAAQLDSKLFEELDHPLSLIEAGFHCSSWIPEITVNEETREVHVADAGQCSVYTPKDENHGTYSYGSLERPASTVNRPQAMEVWEWPERADEYFQDGNFSRGWLYERNTSHIDYVGRIGSTCSMDVAVNAVERLHDHIEVAKEREDPRSGIPLLATDQLRRSCALTSPSLMSESGIDHYLYGFDHWFSHFNRLDDTEQERLRRKLLDLGEFAAAQGFESIARRWVRGILVFDLEAHHDGNYQFRSEKASQYLSDNNRPALADVYANDSDTSDRSDPELPHKSAVYAQWVRDFLDHGELAHAAGADALVQAAGGLSNQRRIDLDTAIFRRIHAQVMAAWKRDDIDDIAAHLWLLDDWLVSGTNSPTSRMTPRVATSPSHSDFPYIDPELPDQKMDNALHLSKRTAVQADEQTLDGLFELTVIAHKMGRKKWHWPRVSGGGDGLPLISRPNAMPVLEKWFLEILRHQPDRPDIHAELGDWYWHRAEWERGFDGRTLSARLREAADSAGLHELGCDEKERRFEELQQQVTQALIVEQNSKRDKFRDEARTYYQRHVELQEDEDAADTRLRKRLNTVTIAGCETSGAH